MPGWKSLEKVGWKRVADGIYILLAILTAFALGYYLLGKTVRLYLGKLGDGDEAAVLFGTGTVVLTGVALLIAIVAFYGWDNIRGKVEDEVKRYMLEERKYDQAQGRFTQGVSFGAVAMFLMRLPIDEQTGERNPRFLLDSAISFTERSLPGLEGTDLEQHAKNNLAYYLALRGWKKDAARALRLLDEAELSWKAQSLPLSLLLTKGEVLARYGYTFGDDAERVLGRILEDLEETSGLTEMDEFKRSEYDLVLQNLRSALDAVQTRHGTAQS